MMTDESGQSQAESPTIDPEFIRLQFEQAVETFRAQFSLYVQGATVLVIANMTLISYAISTQIAGVLLVGPVFPLAVLFSAYAIGKLQLPIAYTAVSLEDRYAAPDVDWLVSTFLATTFSAEYVTRLRSINAIQDPAARVQRLRSVSPQWVGSGKRIGRTLLLLAALGQVVAPFLLIHFFNWRWF